MKARMAEILVARTKAKATPPPVAGGKHCYYKRTLIDHKDHALPFTTRQVALTDLKVGDVVAEEKAWETEDVVLLYKVVRINKKTISVKDCDESGRIMVYGSGEAKSKLSLWANRKFDVVN